MSELVLSKRQADLCPTEPGPDIEFLHFAWSDPPPIAEHSVDLLISLLRRLHQRVLHHNSPFA